MATKFTVFFEDPFWVGVIEKQEDGKLSVCKITFGAEPKDSEIYEFMLKHYADLRFSKPVAAEEKQRADSPKRRQREAKKLLENVGVGTKSQQALQQQREAAKTERKQQSKEQRDAEKQRLFDIKQQKKKEKRRGH